MGFIRESMNILLNMCTAPLLVVCTCDPHIGVSLLASTTLWLRAAYHSGRTLNRCRSLLPFHSSMDPVKAKAHKYAPTFFEYTARDAIIYALGVGATAKKDLRYVYENHDEFIPLPTYVVAPGLLASGATENPGVAFDLTRILHGEQYIEVYGPLPTDAKLRSETRLVDLLDKGSGALILTEVTTFDESSGKKLATQQFGTFQVGSGGFGGARTSPEEKKAATIPDRKPDKVIEEKTAEDQATLYRLGSGDLNPLHIDPTFAQMSGFKQPILHGLCSLGFATRHVLKAFADNDATKFRAIKVRFSNPVIPGQTLLTEMWQDGNTIIFQVKAKETGKVVVANGRIELSSVSTSSSSSPSAATATQNGLKNAGLKSAAVFEQIGKELPNQSGVVEKVKAIYLYDLTKSGKSVAKVTLDLKNGKGSVYDGEPKGEKPTVTVTIDDEDFVKLTTGELDGTKAFMSGKLKAKGNIMALQKLTGVLKGAGKSKL